MLSNNRSDSLVFLMVLICMFALPGCGGGTRPELGQVQGTLTIDGRPLPDAIVVFSPVSGGRQSMGVTDSEGNYKLKYIRQITGAKLGHHKITIKMAAGAKYRDKIPARYNTQSDLTEEVKPDENVIDFALTSS